MKEERINFALAEAINVALADYLTDVSSTEAKDNASSLLLLFLTLDRYREKWSAGESSPLFLLPLLRHLLDSYLLLAFAQKGEEVDQDLLLSREEIEVLLTSEVKAFLRRFGSGAQEILARENS